jgi:predicted dehydrogenase
LSTHRLRAGVIGAGAIGQQGHIPGFQAAGVEIAAVCDSNFARAQEVAHRFSIPKVFADYRELLAQPEIDMVSVGLPNSLHAPVTIEALNAGKHVLCEKPMTTSSALAAEMIAAAQKNGRLLSVNQHMRFDRTARAMRDIIAAGHLGRVYLAESKWVRQQGIPGFGSWFTNKDLAGGGALYDIGVHLLDLILYLLDFPEVVAVKGFLSGELGKQKIGLGGWGADRFTDGRFDVDDTAFAVLTLKDGAQIRLLATWAAFGPGEDRVTLYGTQGGLDRSGLFSDSPSLKYYSAQDGKIVAEEPDLSPYPNERSWLQSVGAFVSAVRGEAPLAVLPEQALQVVRILEATAASATSGREVSL